MEGQASELEAAPQPVLPDGRPELIVHLGDAFERIGEDGRTERQASVIFAGQLTNQLLLKPTGRIAVAAVRFRPEGASALLAIPQSELIGLTAPVEEVAPAIFGRLADVLEESATPAQAAALLLDALEPRLRAAAPDRRIRHVVDAIEARRGLLSIDRVAREAGMTRRHLERRFHQLVGLSPKRLARVARFQHALSRIEGSEGHGARTAAECGYADQAHFIRDFRALAGCAPGAHLLQRGELTGFFTGTGVARPR
jgi:AraC-like DNA-binding protein